MPSVISLKRKSMGPDVVQWQKIIGVPVTGVFDEVTDTKTRQWQTQHKLLADGAPGKNSWEAAGVPFSGTLEVSPQAKSTDVWAYQVAKSAAPDMPEKHRQYVLTVARGEGHYGRGWKAGEGQGSNNWGAVQGVGPAGAFSHIDYGWKTNPSNPSGPKIWKQYTTNFKSYATPEQGFLDMARIILNGGKRKEVGAVEIKSAIDKGNLHDAVYAQHANGYFELAPEKYLSAVKGNYAALTQSTGWDNLLEQAEQTLIKKGMSIISLILGVSALSAIGAVIVSLVKRK